MEGASTGHTPGEISSVWGSTTAADVVGGGGGNRDTLGACAIFILLTLRLGFLPTSWNSDPTITMSS